MANYYASARSNYFKVKDAEAFKTWAASLPGLGVIEKPDDAEENPAWFAIYSDDGDSGSWPYWTTNEDGEDIEIDLPAELSEHLQEGEIAVLIEVGAEKLRYLCGHAVAVNWAGETEFLSLDRIYDLAFERWGIQPTDATY
jgi:hypothetical protein